MLGSRVIMTALVAALIAVNGALGNSLTAEEVADEGHHNYEQMRKVRSYITSGLLDHRWTIGMKILTYVRSINSYNI